MSQFEGNRICHGLITGNMSKLRQPRKGGGNKPSHQLSSSAYFDHLFREWSCSHVRPGKSQARKRRLGPAKIGWLIQPGTVHQHHERHLSRKKKERTSAVE